MLQPYTQPGVIESGCIASMEKGKSKFQFRILVAKEIFK